MKVLWEIVDDQIGLSLSLTLSLRHPEGSAHTKAVCYNMVLSGAASSVICAPFSSRWTSLPARRSSLPQEG
jgi:hypothetical protein